MARQVTVGDGNGGGGFRVCPVGENVARVCKAEYRKVKMRDKETGQMVEKELNDVEFVVIDGAGKGTKAKSAFWLETDDDYDRYNAFCAALGLTKGTPVDPNDPHDALVGRTVLIMVKHKDREYQGQTYTDALMYGTGKRADKAKYPDTAPGEKGHANPDPTGGGTAASDQDDSSLDELPF